MKKILLSLIVLFAGCTASLEVNPQPGYYESVCDENGCQLVPRDGVPPANADIVGQTEGGVFIYKRHVPTPLSMEPIVPSQLPPETFPSPQQWKKIIEHNDPSNPNNTIGYAEDGVELRGPLKTIYLEPDNG